MNPQPDNKDGNGIFLQAAHHLAGERHLDDAARARVEKFLNVFDYASADASRPEDSAMLDNRVALLRAASEFGIFRLRSRGAPGLTFFGATARPRGDARGAAGRPASLVGAGTTARQAFEACVGEGVEYLSQFRDDSDRMRTGSYQEVEPWGDASVSNSLLELTGGGATERIDWIAARSLSDDTAGWLPASIVVRDPAGGDEDARRFALSSGCAAGPTWTAAVGSALFELLERDAVALWWKGASRGSPIALEVLAGLGVPELLADIRQGSRERVTSLLDISGDLGIPCVAAVSFDRGGGRFAGGYACNPDAGRACRAAIVEMCQMELGQELVSAKRARPGIGELGEADLAVERRMSAISIAGPRLAGGLLGAISLREAGAHMPQEALSEALRCLAERGFHAFAVDLTRAAFGVPVARVVVPGLQPYPARFVSRRLAGALGESLQNVVPADNIELF
jgi:ribosomal protein S12 methylthiotransferase accessory factor